MATYVCLTPPPPPPEKIPVAILVAYCDAREVHPGDVVDGDIHVRLVLEVLNDPIGHLTDE